MPPEPVGDSSEDPKPVTATLQVVLVMLALVLVIGMAGIPGLQPAAGNGSLELRRGWAETRSTEASDPASDAAGDAGSSDGAVDAPR